MKYIRRFAAILIAAAFIAAVVIGIGVIFAVRNVNVTLLCYSSEIDNDAKIAKFKSDIADKVRGNLISFVDEDEIQLALKDDGYVLEDLKKVYPCTVNITLRERRETFAIRDEDGFSIFDENGEPLRTAKTEAEAQNNLDNSPNLYIFGTETNDDIRTVAGVCAIFKDKFGALRSVASSVTLKKAVSQLEKDTITFSLRCGVELVLQDFAVSTEEKTAAGYEEFTELSGEQKLEGAIICLITNSGKVSANYIPKV